MNEAERCDSISLMHAGKLLAVGAPEELVHKRGSSSLEEAFISYLAEAAGIKATQNVNSEAAAAPTSLRSWPVMGVCATRDDGTPARPDSG